MPGAIIMVIVLVVIFPPLVWGGYATVALVMGQLLKDRAVDTHEGSELIETNV